MLVKVFELENDTVAGADTVLLQPVQHALGVVQQLRIRLEPLGPIVIHVIGAFVRVGVGRVVERLSQRARFRRIDLEVTAIAERRAHCCGGAITAVVARGHRRSVDGGADLCDRPRLVPGQQIGHVQR